MKYNQYSSIEKTSAFSKKNWSLIQLLLDIFTKTKKGPRYILPLVLKPREGHLSSLRIRITYIRSSAWR